MGDRHINIYCDSNDYDWLNVEYDDVYHRWYFSSCDESTGDYVSLRVSAADAERLADLINSKRGNKPQREE